MKPTDILKAKRVGVRELKDHLSKYINKRGTTIATTHGEPQKVIMDYDDVVLMLELISDLSQPKMLAAMGRGAEAIRRGSEGVPLRVPSTKR